MTNNARFLRRILALDAIGTAAMALGMIVAARPLSALLDMPVSWLVGIGLPLLLLAIWVGSLAKQTHPPRKLVWLLIAGNAVWSVDSIALVLSGWMSLTTLGNELIVAQALITAAITALEFVAIRRTADYTGLAA